MRLNRKPLAISLPLLAALACPSLAQPQETPENRWVKNPANGHSYWLLRKADWTTSARWAKSLGGHLVTIENEEEQSWVFETFAKFTDPQGNSQRLL